MKNFIQEHKTLIVKTSIICSIVIISLVSLEIITEVIDFITDFID